MVLMTSPLKMMDLLKDEEYRKYYLTNPKFPYPLANDAPWRIWIRRPSSKKPGRMVWTNRRHDTFKNAWADVRKNYRQWDDFSITSMVIGFRPPIALQRKYKLLDWCMRCRRPVEFQTFHRHHALNNDLHQWFSDWPVCPYCGGSNDTMTVVKG